MKLYTTLAGIKFAYENPKDLAQQLQAELVKVKEKQKEMEKELLPLKKKKVLFEKALKQFMEEPKSTLAPGTKEAVR